VAGLLAWLSGDFETAAGALREALDLNRALDRPWQVAFSTVVLGAVRHEQGSYADAHALLTEGLRLCRSVGVARNTAFALGLLLRTAHALGRGDEFEPLMRAQLQAAAEMNDRSAEAFILENLALALQAGPDPAQARGHFDASIQHYQDLGDRWSAARVLGYLGQFELAQGCAPEAERRFAHALRSALAAEALPLALDALAGLAEVYAARGEAERARSAAAHVLAHPAAGQAARERAARFAGDEAPAPGEAFEAFIVKEILRGAE
jgi:tetratricopeptide (TPR) repeat protein